MEEDVVKPLKPVLYRHYVNNNYVERKFNKADTLFDALNSDLPNIKFALELNPKKFLDTQIIKENNKIKSQVCTQSIGPQKCHFDIRRMQLM